MPVIVRTKRVCTCSSYSDSELMPVPRYNTSERVGLMMMVLVIVPSFAYVLFPLSFFILFICYRIVSSRVNQTDELNYFLWLGVMGPFKRQSWLSVGYCTVSSVAPCPGTSPPLFPILIVTKNSPIEYLGEGNSTQIKISRKITINKP